MSLRHKRNYNIVKLDYIFGGPREKWRNYFEGNIEPACNHRTKIRQNLNHWGWESNRGKFHVIYVNFELDDLDPDRQFRFNKFDIISDGWKYYFIAELPEFDRRISRITPLDQYRFGNRYRAIELNKDLDNIPTNQFYPEIVPLYAEDKQWYCIKNLNLDEARDLFTKIESKRKSIKLSDWKYKEIHCEDNYEFVSKCDLGSGIGEVAISYYDEELDIPHFHIDSISGDFHTCLCLLIPEYFSHGNRFNQQLSKDQLIIINNILSRKKYEQYSEWDYIVSFWNACSSNKKCNIIEQIEYIQPDYSLTTKFIN